jgi:hypothetical protein
LLLRRTREQDFPRQKSALGAVAAADRDPNGGANSVFRRTGHRFAAENAIDA